MNDFKIKLGTINSGENYFTFEIKDQFFEEFTLSEVEYADITVIAFIDKDGDRLGLKLCIDGKINKLLCDICTEEISVCITAETKVIIKKTNNDLVSTDEIFYIKESENSIDLKELIFELIILNLPKKRRHALNNDGSSNCNKEMLDLVSKYTILEEKSSDPRWDALKKLKIK
tara:strand:+ start:2527 stop:3045 length:519 start_codon:yes stop_codon:yes gene_type:complete